MSNQGYTLPDGRKILPPKRSRFNLKYIKIIVVLIVIAFAYMFITVSGYDFIIKCERSTDICTITKSSFVDPITVDLGSFRALGAIDVHTKNVTLKGGKTVYDLELEYGEQAGRQLIGFYFDNLIKANTANMKLKKYIQDGSMQTVEIKKHCYFNEYFCF